MNGLDARRWTKGLVDNEYMTTVYCPNCRKSVTLVTPKGTELDHSDRKCPNCECVIIENKNKSW